MGRLPTQLAYQSTRHILNKKRYIEYYSYGHFHLSSLVLFGLPSNHKSKGWEDLYIQSYIYSANCKGMKLFAKYCDSSKKKMSDTKKFETYTTCFVD